MESQVPKQSKGEIVSLMKLLQSPPRKRLPGIPPEDLMEQGADHLEDDWARTFFMTVAGFTRLLHLLAEEKEKDEILNTSQNYLHQYFRKLSGHEEIVRAIELICKTSIERINLNITFKRMTAILSTGERATLAQGLLDTLWPQGTIPPEKEEMVEEVLIKLMLSQQTAMEILVQWKRDKKPKGRSDLYL
jgi:hypothetical protein